MSITGQGFGTAFLSGHTSRWAAFRERLRRFDWFALVLVLVGGLAIAKFVTMFSVYYGAAVAGAMLLALLLARNLQIGLLLYFSVAALSLGESPGIQSPHSGYKAGVMPSQILLAVLTALWIGRMVFVDKAKLVKSELNVPLIMLGLTALASLIVNNVLAEGGFRLFNRMLLTQIAEILLLALSISAFFLSANAFKEIRWIARVFTPVTLLALYFAAHRILNFEFPIPVVWGSFLLAAGIAFVYARLLFCELGRSQKAWLAFLLAIMLFAAYSKWSWVSGWVAATGAILMVSLYRSKCLAAVLTGVVLIVLFAYPGLYHTVHAESEAGGDFHRFVIWRDAIQMMLTVNPVLGVGPGNYYPYVFHHSTIWFGEQTYTTAHSNYIQIAAELGTLGFAAFTWVIVAGLMAGHRAVRATAEQIKWLPVAATSMLAAIAAAAIFGDYLFPSRGNNGLVTFGTTVYTWLIMGTAVAAANITRGRRHEPTVPEPSAEVHTTIL